MSNFWDFVDARAIVRRLVLFITVWMTYRAFTWAASFAYVSTAPGIEQAAIIAAVTAPIAALQGFVFKSYLDSKQA